MSHAPLIQWLYHASNEIGQGFQIRNEMQFGERTCLLHHLDQSCLYGVYCSLVCRRWELVVRGSSRTV